MSALDFLTPAGDAIARSPMEGQALAAGARFEVRDGWNVAVAFDRESIDAPVRWADVSHLPKIEVHGPHDLTLGQAARTDGGWRCPITRDRTLVIGDRSAEGVDLTSSLAALTVSGPLAREVFARFCALDLRAQSVPVGGFRPGSVARTPYSMACMNRVRPRPRAKPASTPVTTIGSVSRNTRCTTSFF